MSRRAAAAAMASLIAVSTVAAVPIFGQTSPGPARDTFWFGAGLGVGSEDFAGSLNGSYQFGSNLISVRTTVTAGLFDDGFGDYALLYGRAAHPAGEHFQVGAGTGLALVHGCRGGGLTNCRDVSAVIGLPIEVQAFWRPGGLVGLGLYGFANLNRQQSFGGLTLGLQLGRLR